MNSLPRFSPESSGKLLKVLAISALALSSTVAHAGIKGSKHDLSSTGSAQQLSGSTTEICVFCHTPHGSNTNASVPLWNKALEANPDTAYTRYSALQTSSLDGAEAPIGSVSIACLSCHDGTQAMDVVINAPGSGGYVATGSEFDAGTVGVMTGTPLPNLTQNLKDDHPISIQYAGGGCTATTPACTTFGDADFNATSTANINGVQIWWVDTSAGTDGVREKTDMQLYTRNVTTSTVLEPTVECGSCHDPHADTSTPVSFLRINNSNSAVCLACHTK